MDIRELKEKYPSRFDTEYQKWCEHAADYDWWESDYEWYKEQMLEMGVFVREIEFSGFYCQGDYANWNGRITHPKLFLEKTGLNLRHLAFYSLTCETDDYNIEVGNSYNYYKYSPNIDCTDLGSGYYHDYKMTQGLWAGLTIEEVEQMVDEAKLEEDVAGWVKDQWHDLYKMLQNSYEGLISEEAFIDWCEANDEEFDDEVD